MIKKKPSLYEMILMNNHSKEKINIFKTIEVCDKIILISVNFYFIYRNKL